MKNFTRRISLIPFLFFGWLQSINAQISFIADLTNGCAPMSVQFTNTSSSGVNYNWYFGDGNNFNGYETSHVYNQPGTYSVYLYGYDAIGDYIGDYNIQIVVNGANDFYISADSACPGSPVFFQSYNNADSWYWDFGDGTSENGQSVSHVFGNSGNYLITLLVTTSCGTDTIYKNFKASNNIYPYTHFVINKEKACPNENIVFYPDGDGSPITYDFGDGSQQITTSSNVQHNYSNLGTYVVNASSTNSCGNTSFFSDTISIEPNLGFPPAVSYYTSSSNVCPNEAVAFYSEYGYMQYVWDFGDGSSPVTTTSDYISYSYSVAGNYVPSLTVTNGCGNDTTVFTGLTVSTNKSFPSGMYFFTSPEVACPNDQINFYASNGFANYVWDFGDGSAPQSSGSSGYISYSYPGFGVYPVSVTIYNFCGNDTTLFYSVTIDNSKNIPGWVYFNTSTNNTCPGDSISFNTAQGFFNYSWNFGDGTSENTGQNEYAKHAYSNPGTYSVSLYFQNDCGRDTILYQTININVGGGTFSNGAYLFNSLENTSGCPGDNIAFYATPDYSMYRWDFGDGMILDTTANYLYHVYGSYGTFNPTVRIFNFCGSDTLVSTSAVILDPAAPFPNNLNIYSSNSKNCPGDNISFNTNEGFINYQWDFGDGAININNQNYSDHVYQNLGTYVVSVNFQNNCGRDTTIFDTVYIEMNQYFPNNVYISTSGTALCPGEVLYMSGPSGYSSYLWDFGDGNLDTTQFNNINHIYNTIGSHTPTLTLFNGCGYDSTASFNLIVDNNQPIPGNVYFYYSKGTACPGEPLVFEVNNNFIDYTWNFGDSSLIIVGGNAQNHSFQNIGDYQVSINFRNSCGNDTTLYAMISVNDSSSFPNGINISNYDNACPGDNTPFYAPSGYNIYAWNFGDGVLDTVNEYYNGHVFANPGNYTISLTIFDFCMNDTTIYSNISIGNDGVFTGNVSAGNNSPACPGAYLGTGAEYGYQRYIWNHGDGSPADTTTQNINQHIYTNVGSYVSSVNFLNSCGEDTTIYLNVEIQNGPIFNNGIYLNNSDSVCPGQVIYFSAAQGYNQYVWNFGDGSPKDTNMYSETNHTYANAGNFIVSLTISNACGYDTTISRDIYIDANKQIPAGLGIDHNGPACPGEPVNFNAPYGYMNYIWDFGDGPQTITSEDYYINHKYDSVGNYNVSVTYSNACGNTATSLSVVSINFTGGFPQQINIYNSGPSCPGDKVNFNAPWDYLSYSWNFGDGSPDEITNNGQANHQYLNAGNYSLALTLTNYCGEDTIIYKNIFIDSIAGFPDYVSLNTNQGPDCPGKEVSFSTTGGFASYIWDFGDGSPIDSTYKNYMDHVFDSAGNYVITVRIINNCGNDTVLSANKEIRDDLTFPNSVWLYNSGPECPKGQLVLYASDADGQESYEWNFGDGSPVKTGNSAYETHYYQITGNFQASVRITNFCGIDTILYSNVIITDTAGFKNTPDLWSNAEVVCPGSTVSFSTDYGFSSYSWDFGDGTGGGGASDIEHTFDSVGTYNVSVRITNACGNSVVVSKAINVNSTAGFPAGLNLNTNPDQVCPGEAIRLNTSDGFLSYLWRFGDGDSAVTDKGGASHVYSAAGNYNVSVTISNGCGDQKTLSGYATINNNSPLPALGLEVLFNPSCPGDKVMLNLENGQNNYVYNWDFGDGTTGTTIGAGAEHIYAATGSYLASVTVTNSCGNTGSVSSYVNIENSVQPVLTQEMFGVAGGVSEVGCPGDAVLFYFLGSGNNLWDFGDGYTAVATEKILTENGYTVTIVKHAFPDTGYFNVKLTLINNCGLSATDSMRIYVGSDQLATGGIFIESPAGQSGYTTCKPIKFIGIGGQTYAWDFGDGDTINTVSPTIGHTYAAPGLYTVTLTITNGCGSSTRVSENVSVQQGSGPAITVDSVAGVICFGTSTGTASVSATGGLEPYSYKWNNGAFGSGSSVSNLAPGNHVVTVADAIGCVSIANFTVNNASQISVTSTSTIPDCGFSNGSINITATGGVTPYTYSWNTGSTSSNLTNLGSGFYSVKVTDSKGCTKSKGVTLSASGSPVVTLSTTNNLCPGESAGIVNATVSGGVPPYTFSWSDGSTTEDLTGKESGTYVLTVFDAGGCSASEEGTIEGPESFNLSTSSVNADCGAANGSASVSVTGGTGDYTYSWSNGVTSTSISSVSAGTYLIEVTDSNGCMDSVSVTVANDNAAEVEVGITNVSCNGLSNGAIDLTLSGGTSPFNYSWSTGAIVQDISALAKGSYMIFIQDASNCVAIRTIIITEPQALTATGASSLSYCGNSNGSAEVTVAGGTTPYTYSWSGGETTASITNLDTGLYVVAVLDKNGCSASTNATVTEGQNSLLLSNSSTPAYCNKTNGTGMVTATGGVAPYTYSWSDGGITNIIGGIPGGSYSVVVSDSKGCTSSSDVMVDIEAITQQICVVTVDSILQKNVVVWEKQSGFGIKEFNVYSETTVANEYVLMGTVPFDSLSVFIDTVAEPAVRSYRYKISTLDSCGNESALSSEHKTVHLTSSLGTPPPAVNLVWEDYEGFTFGSYNIYRGSSITGLSLLATVPSNIFTYTDPAPPGSDSVYYAIEVVMSGPCEATRANTNYNSAKSNTAGRISPADSTITRGNELMLSKEINALSIYPNPNRGKFNISFNSVSNEEIILRVYNLQGREVSKEIIRNSSGTRVNKQMDLSGYPRAIYHIEIITNSGILNRKVVVD